MARRGGRPAAHRDPLQDPELLLPWFVRLEAYPGAGPALAWDSDRIIRAGESLRVRLGAVMIDGALDVAAAGELAATVFAPGAAG